MPTPYAKDFAKMFRGLCHSRQPWTVFADFCEAAAMSLANVVHKDEEREKAYMRIAEQYGNDMNVFSNLMAIVVEALEYEPHDFLGEIFQELELANHWHGQFFTPSSVALMMAKMTLDGIEERIEEKGFVTFCEPACGAGATIIAAFVALRDMGLNPQEVMHVQAIDIDRTAAFMCFIQLSLLYIPGVVHVGNTLSMDMRECYCTPAHHLGFWHYRLKWRGVCEEDEKQELQDEREDVFPFPTIEETPQRTLQLSMF